MARTRRFVAAVGSGYLLIAGAAIVNLITFPLALHYLGADWLGVASAAVQSIVFLQLLEFGMGPTFARLIVERRAKEDHAGIAALIKCTFAFGVIQAVVVWGVAIFCAAPIRRVLDIPEQFAPAFDHLLYLMLIAAAVNCLCIPFQQLLYSAHRTDLLNYNAILGNFVSAGVLWIALSRGCGILSYAYSAWTQTIILQGGAYYHASRLNLMPPLRAGRLRAAPFREVFSFATNVWQITLGLQLITYVPVVIITRTFGPAGLAVWRAGTQVLGFAYQLVGRIPQSSEAGFWDMWACGERERLRLRLGQITRIGVTVAVVIGGGIIALNSQFVEVWTRGRIHWAPEYDYGCAMWLLCTVFSLSWNMLPGITMRLGYMRWFYFGEGILLAVPILAGWEPHSIQWVPWLLVVAMVVGRLSYGFGRMRTDLGQTTQELGREIVCSLMLALAVWSCAAVIGAWRPFSATWSNLLFAAGIYSTLAIGILWRFALPADLMARFISRLRPPRE